MLDNVLIRAEVGKIIMSNDCVRRRVCVSALRGRDGTHGVQGWQNVPRMLQSCQAWKEWSVGPTTCKSVEVFLLKKKQGTGETCRCCVVSRSSHGVWRKHLHFQPNAAVYVCSADFFGLGHGFDGSYRGGGGGDGVRNQ